LEEAKAMSGEVRGSLVGLRFGATLAFLAASKRADIDRIVLWDPIVNGRAYLGELAERHRALMAKRPLPRDYQEPDLPAEVLGVPLTASLRSAIAAIDLMGVRPPAGARVAVLSSESDPAVDGLCGHLRTTGALIECHARPGPRVWLKQDDIERTLVPYAALSTVESWLSP
jgi:pimeloyl-ACP methyl ester carboxylesterase